MSGFQIPGLGQAKPNETLPSESFATDLVAAAASLVGVDGVGLPGANGQQLSEQDKKEEQPTTQAAPVPAPTATTQEQPQKASDDAMEVDKPEGQVTEQSNAEDTAPKELDRVEQEAAEATVKGDDTNMTDGAAPSEPPHVAHALEAALDGLLSNTTAPAAEASAPAETATDNNMEGVEGPKEEQPEWEADDSPYESSDDSSSDSSSDDSDDEEGYELLGIEETARLLMSQSGDDHDDGKNRNSAAGGQMRTKNEKPEEPLPKPDVTITEDMKILPLGLIKFIVEKTVVIESQSPGEVQALDTASVLCRGDRTMIGVLQDTIGAVRSPMYTCLFNTEDEIKELGLSVGTEIFYSEQHAKYVFTQVLKQEKGTDASNIHDEEVPDAEMEFSDDEKEAEYKRSLKAKKRGLKGGRGGREQDGRPHPFSNPAGPQAANGPATGLSYDDDDGPYKPLARPANFGQGLPPNLPQLPPKPELAFGHTRGGYGQQQGTFRGGRGDFRGGSRGRGGRGGFDRSGDRRHVSGGYGADRGGYGGQRGYGGQSSPPRSYSGSGPSQQAPQQPPQPPQNPHLPPPPYGANPVPPPAGPGQWPGAGASFIPSFPVPNPYGQQQHQQQQQQPAQIPPAQAYNINYAAWAANAAQAAQAYAAYGGQGQQQGQHPTPPQQQPQGGYRAPAPAAASAWPPVPAPPASGAYVNPAFFGGGLQQPGPGQGPAQGRGQPPVPQPAVQGQQQQYWGQHQQGGYGQQK
ncbi:Gar1/Naf1 RNA binding region-domain-containing protein [Coniochaeta sp. 2T2.1]|nr:Gar1/Naf1 RNA binding region-domain-containing protein [Coniochaeta sp. 2T2.1]